MNRSPAHPFSQAARFVINKPFCTTYEPKITKDGFCYWDGMSVKNLTCNAYNQTIRYNDYSDDVRKNKSVVTEFNLVCNKYWPGRIVFHVVSGLGSCFGSILIAIMADRCGRRPAMGVSMVTMAAGAVLETFMPGPSVPGSEYLVMIFTFVNSFGKWALFQVSLVSGRLASFPTLAIRSTSWRRSASRGGATSPAGSATTASPPSPSSSPTASARWRPPSS